MSRAALRFGSVRKESEEERHFRTEVRSLSLRLGPNVRDAYR